MTGLFLEPHCIERIASQSFDTKSLHVAVAEALVAHNLAVAATESMAVGIEPTQAERLLLADRKRRIMEMMMVVGATKQVSSLLAANGIANLALKGPALALQSTGSWSGRSSCDADFLIDPTDYCKVHDVFVANGYHRRDAAKQGASRFRQWACCEIGYRGWSVNIDLHWRLDPTPAQYKTSFARLMERAEKIAIEGTAMMTLGRLDAWLFTAVHGARSDWVRWSMLLDALRQYRGLTTAERIAARELAAEVGCTTPLAIAEALVFRLSPETSDKAPGDWALARADRVIAQTSGGSGPQLSLAAALSRRIRLSASVPGRGGALGSLARAVGRLALAPGDYREHVMASLRALRMTVD